MNLCQYLEQPGRWRAVGVIGVLGLGVAPTVPLLAEIISRDTPAPGAAFVAALTTSAAVAVVVAVLSWCLGLPGGVALALYDFPGRRFFLTCAVLPLLLPAFLLALGWSVLTARLGMAMLVTGMAGGVLVGVSLAVPLALLTAYAATANLSNSQADAVRLAGGERALFFQACRQAASPAALAATLGGVLTLSDPAPGLLFQYRTAAQEILTSFAALHDYPLAAAQCIALSGVALAVALPVAVVSAPRLAAQLLVKQTRPLQRVRPRAARRGALAFALYAFVATALPLVGLGLPALAGGQFERAGREVLRTGVDTVAYAVGAGLLATLLGLLLAVCVGRSQRLLRVSLTACVVLIALPPSLAALGVVQLVATAPAWADDVLRGRFVVGGTLALRFLPIAALLSLRAWAAMPAGWALVASMHGVPLHRYVLRVLLPHFLPVASAATVLVGLLATADVGTVLLVHPPGKQSLPLAIFTIMSVAPEALVASLCLVYAGLAAALLLAVSATLGRRA